MKKKELYSLKDGILQCLNYEGGEFGFLLNLNLIEVEKQIKALEGSKKKYSENLDKYTQEEMDIHKKYAIKNKEGDFVLDKGFFTFNRVDDEPRFKEIKALQEKYAGAIEEYTAIKDEYNSLLESELEMTFTKIKRDQIPAKIIGRLLTPIMVLIE